MSPSSSSLNVYSQSPSPAMIAKDLNDVKRMKVAFLILAPSCSASSINEIAAFIILLVVSLYSYSSIVIIPWRSRRWFRCTLFPHRLLSSFARLLSSISLTRTTSLHCCKTDQTDKGNFLTEKVLNLLIINNNVKYRLRYYNQSESLFSFRLLVRIMTEWLWWEGLFVWQT